MRLVAQDMYGNVLCPLAPDAAALIHAPRSFRLYFRITFSPGSGVVQKRVLVTYEYGGDVDWDDDVFGLRTAFYQVTE